MVDHVLSPSYSVVASRSDEVVVLLHVTFSCCDVVGVRAVTRHATKGGEIVTTVATWLGISAERNVSKVRCCQWNILYIIKGVQFWITDATYH